MIEYSISDSDRSELSQMFSETKGQLALTGDDLNIFWKNSPMIIGNKVRINGEGEYITDSIKGDTKLIHNSINYKGKTVHIFKLPSTSDVVDMMGTGAFHRIYAGYISSIKTGIYDFLNIENETELSKETKEIIFRIMHGKVIKVYHTMENLDELEKVLYNEQKATEFELKSRLEDFMKDTELIAKNNGCTFTYSIEKHLMIETNPVRLRNTLANLIANGFMYNKSTHKKVELRIFSDNKNIYIRIADNGGGISKELLEDSKAPFSHIGEGSNGRESLGLYLARRYVKSMNGTIDFKNENGGLAVTIKLKNDPFGVAQVLHEPPFSPYTTVFKKHYNILSKAFDKIPNK